jgi:hypothetical protein
LANFRNNTPSGSANPKLQNRGRRTRSGGNLVGMAKVGVSAPEARLSATPGRCRSVSCAGAAGVGVRHPEAQNSASLTPSRAGRARSGGVFNSADARSCWPTHLSSSSCCSLSSCQLSLSFALRPAAFSLISERFIQPFVVV